ncbi:MAG: flagellar basal body P-ring protein FlgI [Planctomycetota bacterium]
MSTLRPLGWWLLVAVCASFPLALLARDPKPNGKLGGGKPPATSVAQDDDDSDDANPDNDRSKRFATKVETPLIGDYTSFAGLEPVVLEGVGLVVGLNGTGGDPAPSKFRTALMEDLKKNGLPNPNGILQRPDTTLVLVRAKLPPLLKKGEKIDVEVRVPDSVPATSLAGGWLMEVYLTEQAFIPGRGMLKGHAYAKAEGAILTAGIGRDAAKAPALLKQGRVLSGATVLKERDLSLFLRNEYRSIRTSTRIAEVIGRRFHHFDKQGIKKPMAEAKTDQKIVLSVHPKYKDNYPRYLQVIRHMSFKEDGVATRVRMQRLQQDLFVAEKADETALQLEAIGGEAVPILKQGLTSPLIECRFHSAIALAYLGSSDGLAALVEAARTERAFRVFAFAAMSTLEDADAHIALRDLMNESTAETRYGAFRALWTLDKNDPFIRGETLALPEDLEGKKNRNLGEYKLHVLHTSGEPMVHTTLRTRPEVVVFGADQEFRAPIYLTAGRHIMVTAQPGATTASLARFEVGKPDQRREVSLRVTDVIHAADELGATYPDIVQMLADASTQKNLPTRLAADELPEGGRVYYRPSSDPSKPGGKKGTKVGKENFTPNMFPEQNDPDEASARKEKDRKGEANSASMANVPHETTVKNDTPPPMTKKKEDPKPKRSFPWFGGSKK